MRDPILDLSCTHVFRHAEMQIYFQFEFQKTQAEIWQSQIHRWSKIFSKKQAPLQYEAFAPAPLLESSFDIYLLYDLSLAFPTCMAHQRQVSK